MVFEEQLIKTVRKHPIIYDKLADGYNSMLARESAWVDIGEKIGQKDINFLKKRWRSLRDTFIKFYRNGKTQKSVEGNSRKKRWRYYDIMEFLIPYIEHKIIMNGFKSTAVETNSQNEYRDGNEIHGEELQSESQESAEAVLVQDENSIFLQMEDDCIEEPTSKIHCLPLETLNPLMDTAGKSNDSDIHFLLSCTSSLKRLSPRKNLLARIQIQKLLYEFEYGNQNYYH
ncbi:unnamed protein product [Ceutorhynchus assimilis]|uniref:Transcription factor Adf-1 n=1 Tax=Ceutorhynchus assimilis TaxID=467358 RepID=A0A9N9M8T9_9CUCU|nr:unnamed protein product [Ceutorhynchus assimilis]